MQLLFSEFPIAFVAVAFVVALLIGSFLNVVIYRLPVMMEIQWRKQCEEFAETPATDLPEGRFDLVLCRNLAFTYFAADRQRVVLQRLSERLRRGGILVIGGHEMLPDGGAGFRRLGSGLPVYRKSS